MGPICSASTVRGRGPIVGLLQPISGPNDPQVCGVGTTVLMLLNESELLTEYPPRSPPGASERQPAEKRHRLDVGYFYSLLNADEKTNCAPIEI